MTQTPIAPNHTPPAGDSPARVEILGYEPDRRPVEQPTSALDHEQNLLMTYPEAAARIEAAQGLVGRIANALMLEDAEQAAGALDLTMDALGPLVELLAQVPRRVPLSAMAQMRRRDPLPAYHPQIAAEGDPVRLTPVNRGVPVTVHSDDLFQSLRRRHRNAQEPLTDADLRLWDELEVVHPGTAARILGGYPENEALPGWSYVERDSLRDGLPALQAQRALPVGTPAPPRPDSDDGR